MQGMTLCAVFRMPLLSMLRRMMLEELHQGRGNAAPQEDAEAVYFCCCERRMCSLLLWLPKLCLQVFFCSSFLLGWKTLHVRRLLSIDDSGLMRDMRVEDVLKEKRSEIAAKWLRAILDTYPPEASRFLKREKDQFANPVGHTIHSAIEAILDHLLNDADVEEVLESLDAIIRIKAVQDFSPAGAVDFLFRLKHLVREEVKDQIRENRISVENLLEFESKMDALALHGFNLYMKCREKICDIRVSQVQNRAFQLLKRANLIVEFPDPESDPETDLGDVENSK